MSAVHMLHWSIHLHGRGQTDKTEKLTATYCKPIITAPMTLTTFK